jgi:cytoskeleton protein RodZ
MKNDKESLSFGRYLQAIRLEKKISLEQVSEQTRIGLGNLLLVEQEDFEQLPAPVFVKGFLRAYANAIGADGDEAVRRFLSRRDVVQKIAESEASVGKPAARLWWKLLFSVFLLLCIIALSIAVISYLGERSGADKAHQPAPSAAQEQPVASGEQGGADLSGVPSKATPEKMRLQITALTNTWVKVIVDEKDSKAYNLNSGDRIELEAISGYNLLIGDAGGIKISLNERPVPIPGESGQVVTMHLP